MREAQPFFPPMLRGDVRLAPQEIPAFAGMEVGAGMEVRAGMEGEQEWK